MSAAHFWSDDLRGVQQERTLLIDWYLTHIEEPLPVLVAVTSRLEELAMRVAGLQEIIALECAPWFEPVAPGNYSVYSVGEAGVPRVEFSGFHYPYQALEKEAELNAARGTGARFSYFSQNDDEPESSVEREDEAYFAYEPINGRSTRETVADNMASRNGAPSTRTPGPTAFPPERDFACLYCDKVHLSPAGLDDGSDIACCGEVGHVEPFTEVQSA